MERTLTYGANGDARIKDFRGWLKMQDADEIIVRTTWVSGCWSDIEFDANRAGYRISRFQNPEWTAKHEFAEAYKLVRK